MEGQRFDRITKTLARWTSRRRFLAGLAGGAASIPLGRSAGAQDSQQVEDLQAVRDAVVQQSEEATVWIEGLRGQSERLNQINELLPEFLDRLQLLIDDGRQANQQPWSDDTTRGYLTTISLLPLSISTGTMAYLDRWAQQRIDQCCAEGGGSCVQIAEDPRPPQLEFTRDPGAASIACVTPDQTLDDVVCGGVSSLYEIERPTLCMSECCVAWRDAEAACGTDGACLVEAFWTFMRCLLPNTDDDICTAGSQCLAAILFACGGDCRP